VTSKKSDKKKEKREIFPGDQIGGETRKGRGGSRTKLQTSTESVIRISRNPGRGVESHAVSACLRKGVLILSYSSPYEEKGGLGKRRKEER